MRETRKRAYRDQHQRQTQWSLRVTGKTKSDNDDGHEGVNGDDGDEDSSSEDEREGNEENDRDEESENGDGEYEDPRRG